MNKEVWRDAEVELPPAIGGDSIWRHDSARVLCAVKSELDGGVRCEVGTYSHYGREWTEFERNEYRGTSFVTHWMPLPEPPK